MCLVILTSEQKKLKIAKSPIVGFKDGTVSISGQIFRPCFHDDYEYLKLRNQPITHLKIQIEYIDSCRDKWIGRKCEVVNYGYHTHCYPGSNEGTQVFVIPKGAFYFEGEQTFGKGYVSSNIIWVGSMWSPKTWFNVLRIKFNFFNPIKS